MEIIQFFSIVGTVAFSIQGGLIAIKNKYDLFAVYLFGMITAFGGALRHIVIGESTHDSRNQDNLFYISVISITLTIVFPNFFERSEIWWMDVLDGVGVIAFAMQGSISALNMDLPASAVVVAALITGTGGGVFRDLLSQRKPILLGENIYSLWIFLIGLIIGMRWATANLHFLILYAVFTTLRLLSYYRNWIIPYRHY